MYFFHLEQVDGTGHADGNPTYDYYEAAWFCQPQLFGDLGGDCEELVQRSGLSYLKGLNAPA